MYWGVLGCIGVYLGLGVLVLVMVDMGVYWVWSWSHEKSMPNSTNVACR